MRAFLAALILAASFSLPVSTHAEAGFVSGMIKGAIKNSVRHTVCKLKRTC